MVEAFVVVAVADRGRVMLFALAAYEREYELPAVIREARLQYVTVSQAAVEEVAASQ